MINEKEFLNSAPAQKEPTTEDLKKQKLKLQIEILEEKKKNEQIKQRQKIQRINKTNKTIHIKQQPQKKKSSLFYILLLPLCIAFAPFIILGWILITCTKNAK